MDSTTDELTPEQYEEAFAGKEPQALEQALDIRKFEIELYWKRATYFWTFIGASLAGFIAIQASDSANKQDLAIILASLGLVFSFAWFCANRGSKFWQENWEKHVDQLEDKVTGPLYKIILARNKPASIREKCVDVVTGPGRISVSKINQLISLYVCLLWVLLLGYSLPEFAIDKTVNWFYMLIIGLSICTCLSFLWLGRSYGGGYFHTAQRRKSRVRPANKSRKTDA